MAALSAWFWNERFWLPHNVTWADLADPAPGVEYPKAGHLFSALPLALGIFALRILFERCVASPCARSLLIHPGVGRRAHSNAVLEKVFTSITKSPDSRHLDGLSKQLDWEVRKVQRWFRNRRNQDKPSTHTKFCESMWRFTFYLCIFTYGFRFLWQTPWMWDTRHCWYGYPYQVMTPGLYYYYVTELAFYWSLMFSQFTDIKRKLAKLANYAKYQRLCDFLFIVFSVAFFITRLVIYPIWVLNSTMFESWAIVGPYPSWWLFNFLLLVLQVLHIIWSYLIARIAVKAVLRGKVCNDVRSDIESSSENEPDTPTEGPKAFSHSPKGENGTNGHCAAAKARVQNHSSW
ncbi:ceramide synthase 5 isoform X2 [Gymnodraco acuticeps]|uniref:Ceramide synthase 5 isoform X2 n=1 Tax=Gymnodraco acuticeps TaxID=8218 RepID=A0A6P8U2I2_GYMAC|nr:ceramide synthase 5 isoform X2 [Gymnodraco acuticeps]